MTELIRTPRSTVRRLPARGVYDRHVLYALLDEALICHGGFAVDGVPFVVPMIFGRAGDTLYLHGSSASRFMRSLAGGVELCVTVTLLDGLVLARSAFHHSMNYRSAMIFGTAAAVEGEEKITALRAISEHTMSGRWNDVRPPSDLELKATSVLSLTLEEASVKIRSGPPKDDEEDYALDVWAGEIPMRIVLGEPQPDERTPPEREVPEYVQRYRRG